MHRADKFHRMQHIHHSHKIRRILFGDTPIDRDLKLLLIIGGLFALSVALSNTFVNIYLWKQQSEYMTIALYNLSIVVAQPLVFILAGRWAKQVDRIIVLRLGVVFLSIFFFVVLWMGDVSSQYPLVLGALLGVGFGFYWLAFNVMTFEITEPDTRDIFNGFFGLLNSFAGMIGPFFAGWLITKLTETTGYHVIFSVSLVLFVLAVLLSFFMNRRSSKGKYRLGHVLKWRNSTQGWRRILMANVAQGLREGSFSFLITIWVFVATDSEMALGVFGLVTSGVSLLAYYMAGRFIKPRRRKVMIFIGALVLSLSVFIIAFELTFFRLIVYGVVISIVFPMLMVPFLSMSFDKMGQAKHAREWRIEYIVSRELFLNAGRVVSVVLFIGVILLFDTEKALPYYIIVLGNSQLLLYSFVRKIKS